MTLAFLTSWADDPTCIAGRLDIFSPLIAIVLCNESPRGLRLGDIQKSIDEQFGLNLPRHVISKVLSVLKREDIVEVKAKAYFFKTGSELSNPDLLKTRDDLLNQQKHLVAKLVAYCNEEGYPYSEEDIRDALSHFLTKYCTVYVMGRAGDSRGQDGTLIEGLIARYLAVHGSEDDVSGTVTALARGSVLYSAAFLGDWNQKNPLLTLSKTSVYLDTPIVLNLLDFGTEEDRKFASEAVGALQAAEARVKVFDSTLNEVSYILQSAVSTYDDPALMHRFRIIQLMHKRGVTKAELAERAALVEIALSGLGVEIVEKPCVTRALRIDERGLRLALEEPGFPGSSSRVDYDVRSIEGILTLRGSREARLLSKCNAVLAVMSGEVIGHVHSWWKNVEHNYDLPPVLGLRELANYAWFIHPIGFSNVPLDAMLASCAASLNPSERCWNSFVDYVVERKGMSEVEKFAILESDVARTVLKKYEDLTVLGEAHSVDYERAVEDAREELVERPKEIALMEQKQELSRLHEEDKDRAISDDRSASEQAVAEKLVPICILIVIALFAAATIALYNFLFHCLIPLLANSEPTNEPGLVTEVLGIVISLPFSAVTVFKGLGPKKLSRRLAAWLLSR